MSKARPATYAPIVHGGPTIGALNKKILLRRHGEGGLKAIYEESQIRDRFGVSMRGFKAYVHRLESIQSNGWIDAVERAVLQGTEEAPIRQVASRCIARCLQRSDLKPDEIAVLCRAASTVLGEPEDPEGVPMDRDALNRVVHEVYGLNVPVPDTGDSAHVSAQSEKPN